MKQTFGFISSEESMGLVDGPGIRYVVFMQGCLLRCFYCHNPETWERQGQGYKVKAKDLVDKIERYKSYFGSDGGVTFSGGEPLLQSDFLIECLSLCKQRGIHTAIDTAGVMQDESRLEEILALTDLVILDVKAIDADEYKYLTGKDIAPFNRFLSTCQKANARLWIRQVILPQFNDDEKHAKKLKEFLKTLANVEKVELLPYSAGCKSKYKKLAIPFRLNDVCDMSEERCKELEKIVTA